MPAVSVVTPVYNGARFLDRAVASVLAQTLPDWELLAVDDGSADDSAARLDAHAAADPRVRVFRHPANRGLSAARNTALAAARGELVAYLDCDDEFYSDHLARAHALRDRGDVLVFRYDLVEERDGSRDAGRVTTYNPAANVRALYTHNLCVPLGVVHRRSLLARVGGFDESLGRFRGLTEDADLWRRFARAGARFAFVPAKSGLYHVRSDSLSRTQPPAPPAPPRGGAESARDKPPARPGGDRGRPRVLFVSYHCHHDSSSGAAVCTRDLFELLRARGWACGAFTGPQLDTRLPGPVAARLAADPAARAARGRAGTVSFTVYSSAAVGYPVSTFCPDPPDPTRPPNAAEAGAFARVFAGAVRQFRPDVVLTYGGDAASLGAAEAARRAGAGVAFWLHNFAYTSAAPLRRCDAVIVPSEASRAHYRAALGVDSTVLPGPWNWERVVAPDPDPRFVTFVNPVPEKGVFWFARIAEVLGKTRPDIPLLVVEGRGGVDWLGRCGVDLAGVRSVHRMRNTPDPRDFYRATRLLLVPSLCPESFGRVAAEAMMNGVPVLASDRGALPEAVGAGGGLLDIPAQYTSAGRTPPTAADAAPWVRAITRLWDDAAAYAAAAQSARARAEEWHPSRLVPRWEEFLARVAANC